MEDVKVDTACAAADRVEQGQPFPHPPVLPVYRWDPAKSAVTITKDWVAYDVK